MSIPDHPQKIEQVNITACISIMTAYIFHYFCWLSRCHIFKRTKYSTKNKARKLLNCVFTYAWLCLFPVCFDNIRVEVESWCEKLILITNRNKHNKIVEEKNVFYSLYFYWLFLMVIGQLLQPDLQVNKKVKLVQSSQH